ncbi:hypothetical protein N7495_000448 [Penicillium taxi]|uniref:uncharacterized protein n=1 Tax=Penicillium taxi TaxID=168475 RepID=UPI0025458BE5|nr:uncharacterized protein N7495_000448 [Penicillium taxi]KAJ5907766.1 hypothetical protein N7495_000448 [Penicillium taxi]
MSFSSRSNVSGSFSSAVQMETVRMEGPSCWVCGTTQPEIAQVVGKADTQNRLNMAEKMLDWLKAGLINFRLTSQENAIPLCPSCHWQYDCEGDPGLVIIPVDLQYFVDFEIDDQKKRTSMTGRQVPIQATYAQHCRTRYPDQYGPSPSPDNPQRSGLYRVVFLKKYLLPDFIDVAALRLTQPKQWHGAPSAMLRRCFMACGTVIRPKSKMGKQTFDTLCQLRELYFPEQDEEIGYQVMVPQSDDQDSPSSDEEAPPSDEKARKRPATWDAGPPAVNRDKKRRRGNTDSSQNLQDDWLMGPGCTAADCIARWAPVCHLLTR